MHISLLGTRGVPARYGGFETCVDEVGRRLVDAGHRVTVYCRTRDPEDRAVRRYRGMELVHLPSIDHKALETLSHTGLSVLHRLSHHRPDAAIVFNAANAPFLPLLRARGIPVATHVDGLEWKRAKWGRAGRRFYRVAEALAVRWSDALIADATGIADYYRDEFGAATRLIRYGAPTVHRGDHPGLAELGLTPDGYHLVVARFEPENNLHVIVPGYVRSTARKPLVVVGDAPHADEYKAQVRAGADERVIFLGSVWDQTLLDQLYANSHQYVHGHQVGGTNPSLLRAIGAGAAVLAHDNVFNREVLGEAGTYFRGSADVARELEAAEADPEGVLLRGKHSRERATDYTWDDVALSYEKLALDLCSGRARRDPRVTGRRRDAGLHA